MAVGDGDDLVHRRHLADEVEHRALAHLGGRAQRQAGDGAQVVLELAALGAFDGPVPGVVHARGDLVGLQAAVHLEELEGQHADVVQLLQHAAGVVFRQRLQRMVRAGHGEAQDAVHVGVVHQRVAAHLAVAAAHRHQRHLAGEGHEAFEDARHAAQLGEGTGDVFGRAQDLLALAVITEGAGLQHARQADAGHRGIEVGLRLDVGEGRSGDAQLLEHRLLEPAVAGDAQGFGAGVDRHELREEGHGLGRHALELEGHQVDLVGQLAQVVLVAVVGADVLAEGLGAGVRRRVEEGEVHAQRSARQGQHAAELAATDDTDFHGSAQASRGSGLSSTVSVCSERNTFSAT
ncbi:hypothetical protein D3C76_975820 [compost metagenome]